MNYYNPFQANLLSMMQQRMIPQSNQFMSMQTAPTQQKQPINPQQFVAVARTLDNNSLQQLVKMAKQKGISDQDIQAGLNFIQSIKSN